MAKTKDDKDKQPETVTCVYLSYTPCHFNHEEKEYSLHNNETYELPNCPYVQSLIGQGKLIVKK